MSRFPTDFLDAENVLADLRAGNFIFSQIEYKIAFDDKISFEDLAELESNFSSQGYFYEGVEIRVIGKSPPYKDAFFVYPMKKK